MTPCDIPSKQLTEMNGGRDVDDDSGGWFDVGRHAGDREDRGHGRHQYATQQKRRPVERSTAVPAPSARPCPTHSRR